MAEKIKSYYKKGYYQKRHILAFYSSGVITAAEYADIVGSEI